MLDINDLSSENLQEGQKIFIPGARLDSNSLRKAMGELFANPLKIRYRLTSRFGSRADPFTGVASHHTGIDMAFDFTQKAVVCSLNLRHSLIFGAANLVKLIM